jgi:hypothetical protein
VGWVAQLRGVEVDERVMSFLEASELLVEIADDLYDYEEDVADGAFNVYRLFIHMYGSQVWMATCLSASSPNLSEV